MSDIVKQIRESAESVVQTALGSEWKLLDHKFDLTKNSFVNKDKRFGVVQLDGPPGGNTTKHYTVARVFQIYFAQKYLPIQQNDSAQQVAIDLLEDALDEAAVTLINTKVGLPSLVNNVDIINIEEPDLGIEENLAVLVLTLTIQYRRRLST